MIGIAKNFAASAPIVNYNVFLTPGLSATIGPVSGSATSNQVTVNIEGEVDPVTYVWLKISGDPITIDDGIPTSVTFSANSSNGILQAAVYEVEATDSDGVPNVDTAQIFVTFEFGG